ncbi:MAG: substrate-binding domain-containing protein [Thermoanaerobaculia bacterium]|nr:substrate-binding domain-containing protein [Thermoanaerobaculia bacterium]
MKPDPWLGSGLPSETGSRPGSGFYRSSLLLLTALLLISAACVGIEGRIEESWPLRINGSTTVNPVAAEAAEILRAERKMRINVDTQGGSSGGISGIGEGTIDVGMSSKPVNDAHRERWPQAAFVETSIGVDAVALVVSPHVAEAIDALTLEEVRSIYEGTITNWSEFGGPNQQIIFFNKEPGRGTWEVFVTWLYGDPDRAPVVDHPEVGGNEEGRTKVASTSGAISQLSASWATATDEIAALGIELEDGTIVTSSAESIRTGRYPMARQLFFITNGEPKGDALSFIDFVLSDRGQDLVRKHGYLGLDDMQ